MSNSNTALTFSVVINNYNYARFLAGAIESALTQLESNDEIILVDDGSTDDSIDIINAYADNRQINVIHQQNQGQLKAVRHGIMAARGDIVLMLDSDDEYLPGYLQRLRDIYLNHTEVDFVLAAADVRGENSEAVRRNKANLIRMSISPGVIGATRWATQLSYEFVGVPTSGISLKRPLALSIFDLPVSLDARKPISPLITKLLRIPENEARNSGLTADGVIVRTSSMMGAIKYSDSRPGFIYRIHSNNKFATNTRLGQYFVRVKRRRAFLDATIDYLKIAKTATASELQEEIEQRLWGVKLRRRLHVRAQYAMAVLRSRGSLREKFSALKSAVFSKRTT